MNKSETSSPPMVVGLDRKVRERKSWPSYVASFLINDMTGACKKRGLTVANCGVDPNDIGLLLHWNYEGYIDRKTARGCLEYMLDKAAEVREFMDFAVDYARQNTKLPNAKLRCASDSERHT